MTSPEPGVTLTEADRELLFARLSAHAAADHIDLEELERRVAAVSAAQTRGQAHGVLADLPALPEPPNALGQTGSPGFGDQRARPGAEPGRPRWGRGHGEADGPAPGWRPTDERFRDPRTRQVMRVWHDAAGGRHYVVDDQR